MIKPICLALALLGSAAAQDLPTLTPATVGAYDVRASAPGTVHYRFSAAAGRGTLEARPLSDGAYEIEVLLRTPQGSHACTERVDDFDPSHPRYETTFHEQRTVKVERSMIDAILGKPSSKAVGVEVTLRLTQARGPVVNPMVIVDGETAQVEVTAGERTEAAPGRARLTRVGQDLRLKIQSKDGSWSVDLRAPNGNTRTLIFSGAPAGDTTRGRVEVTVPSLNVRSEPAVRPDTQVTRLSGGTQLEVVTAQGGWRKLRLADGRELWASAKYLRAVPGDGSGNVRLTLRATDAGWSGTLEGAGPKLELELVRRRRVLLVVDEPELTGYATRTWWYYRDTHGFTKHVRLDTHRASDESTAFVAALNKAAADQLPFDRVVLYSHGGWDGPLLGDQIDPPGSSSYDANEWSELVRAVRAGTTPDAKLYFSACHAAGDNRNEFRSAPDDRWWTASLGRATDRWVSGPAGSTSTEYALQQTQASLEGEGTVKQETLVTVGAADVRIYPGRTLAEGKRVHVPAKAR